MIDLSGKKSNIITALMVSLLIHLVAFGVAAAVKSKAQQVIINEYIPVELVQLPSPARVVVPQHAVALRHKDVAAPVVPNNQPVTSPVPVSKATVSPQQSLQEASPSVAVMQQRTQTTPGGGTTGVMVTTTATGSGTAPSPSKSRDKGSYLAFHRLTKLPTFKSRAEPVYPNSERMNGGEARVLAEIYLDERGAVDDVIIKKSGGKLFDKAVIDAARQSSFHPGYMGEKAVSTVIQIPYSFKLK